jgi:tRNA (cmo5U34)-methyltransferase
MDNVLAMDRVGDGILQENANWKFTGNVHETFDAHVSKSVPFYRETHELGAKLADFFLADGSLVYDLGCSTGTFIELLAERNRSKAVRFVGIDSVAEMAASARSRCAGYPNVSIETADILDAELQPCDFVSAYYTIQFVRPMNRQTVFDRIYAALNWGGGFLWVEKVRANDARFQDMMSQLYVDYKLEQGFDAEEIIGKARSIKGVLEPFSTQGNLDLAKRAGFVDVISVFKYMCWEAFLAIK